MSHIKDSVMFVYIHDTLGLKDSNYIYEHFSEFKKNHFDFVNNMMGFMDIYTGTNDSATAMFYQAYFRNPVVKEIYDTVKKRTLPKIEDQKEQIRYAYKAWKNIMPQDSLTKIYFYVSHFENQIIPLNHNIGIALEFYLGKDFQYYPPNENFPKYRIKTLDPAYLAADVARGMIQLRYDTTVTTRFIDEMVYNGKKLYFEKALLPGIEDTILMRYSKEQMQFCYDEEKQIWEYFIDKRINLLFEANREKTEEFFANGPFTNAWRVKEGAPAKFANWTGLRMVEKYMENHPKTTIPQLMKLSADEILKGSKYKPK